MGKIDSWITKLPRLKNSKVARFSYKAEAYANDDIEGVENYDYSRDMNIPSATHTDFDPDVLSTGARSNFSSIPKNGLNHFFGRVSYNLNKVLDFLVDFLTDFISLNDSFISFTEIVSFSSSATLSNYADGTTKRLLNTAGSTITITLPVGETYLGSNTVLLAPSIMLTITKRGTVWVNSSGTAITADKLATARKINGVLFDGSTNITIADSTKAPTSHASSAVTYGVSSEANYGHAKASAVAGSANGTASKGTTPTVFAQSNHVHPLQTSVSGNAGTADKWSTARNITISDADGTNTGTAVSVDGSENETLKLPATIKANVTGGITGNAATADKWKTSRNITISDADGTNTGTAVSVDGSENETLKLPATIKANLTGNASGSSSNVNSTNFFLNEDAAYVNLHTKNAKPLYLNAVNAIAYLYGLVVNIGLDGQKVGILTSDSGQEQPSSAYPIAIGRNVHCNNKSIDYAAQFHCNNNGQGDLIIATGKGALPGYPNDYFPTIKTSYTTLNFALGNVHAFGFDSASGTTTLYSGTNTKMKSQSPFYGAVGNDICDNIQIESPVKDWEYGYCYCEYDGEYKKGNRGIIGITSDTASLHCGSDDGMEAGKDYLPIAIGGFVLAYVDKKYRRGTPLKVKKDGSLTRAYWFTPCWKVVATYQEVPREETWNKATVNGRTIVRVK